ncbi:MAG: geranylgeranyl reductase family protein [Planctomycetales bacterium]|nr:geranylgeranyl reductase family protein [Planctomycetales bacterium]
MKEANMCTALDEQYDCVVIGAGPAGCTTASLVARAGYSTLLVEREKFPRFHIGESLMPEVYWTLERLGVLPKMRELGFVRKVGVQFVTHKGKESQPFFFQQHDPRESSTTWHVERSTFDQMLFENAAEHGATCVDQTRVTDVSVGGEQRSITLQNSAGIQTMRAKVVVDATGQSAMLANRLGLREDNKRLRKASIWTYYKGAKRADDGDNMTVILHTNERKSWFWYIPMRDDIVSIGVVGDNEYLLKDRGTPEQTFHEELAKCGGVQERIANATQTGKYHAVKEFSYMTKQHAGDGWVLIGDAFGFIDPVYSSGVYLALRSGELAADAITDGLAKGDLSAAQLGGWTDEFKQGIVWIRKLVHAFYTDQFSFGAFLKMHPEYVGNLTDLLIGRVFTDCAGKIFDDMDPVLEKASL